MFEYYDKTYDLDKKIFSYQKNLNEFFAIHNYDSYIKEQKNINALHKHALKILFDENSIAELTERCSEAILIYPLCFEAFYVAYYLYDSLSFYYFSLEIINDAIDDYQNDYDINNLVNIYLLLSSFFIDIKNNHESINMLDKASRHVSKDVLLTRYLIAYSFCENDEDMMDLYNTVPFINAKDYILLITCLLKNNKQSLARDVYYQMLDRIKYADLLSRPNEIEDIEDQDAINLLNDVDSCFELIESVPYFFSFISECLESHNKIIN